MWHILQTSFIKQFYVMYKMTVTAILAWSYKLDKNVIPDHWPKGKAIRFRRIGDFNWIEGYIINRE